MGSNVERLVQIALGEVGYLEKASPAYLDDKTMNSGYGNYTKYGKWYGMDGTYWCAMFVSWCFAQAGLSDIAPKYSWCRYGVEWFEARNRFHLKSGYTPQPGDIIFFSSDSYPNGGAHTGIVTSCSGGIVYTVEGNTSGAARLVSNGGGVAEKAYTLSYSPIYGYGTPLWPAEEPEPVPTPVDMKDGDYMTKAEILTELGDKWIERFEDLPDWAKPTMREILDKQFINGGTDYAVDPDDINMFLSDIKTIIVNKRMIDEAR